VRYDNTKSSLRIYTHACIFVDEMKTGKKRFLLCSDWLCDIITRKIKWPSHFSMKRKTLFCLEWWVCKFKVKCVTINLNKEANQHNMILDSTTSFLLTIQFIFNNVFTYLLLPEKQLGTSCVYNCRFILCSTALYKKELNCYKSLNYLIVRKSFF
jgi:hypothetical protein